MENLKLKMVNFIAQNSEIEETDMIFSFNNGKIKIYLSYETGCLKEVIFNEDDDLEKLETKELDVPINFVGYPAFRYKYGLYEYVEIEIEEKLEKYLYNENILYILKGKEVFLRVEFKDKAFLFDKNCSLVGFEEILGI